MSVHLHKALTTLKKNTLVLAALAEEQLTIGLQSLMDLEESLAKRVIERDAEIDERAVDIEEECLRILALYQPVAHDLRFVIAMLKMINDLKHIGDYAVNIADRALAMNGRQDIIRLVDFAAMGKRVAEMLRKSIESLVQQDASLAKEVWRADDEIDDIHRTNFRLVEERLKKDSSQANGYMQLISTSRYLERVADLTTNIADDVVYLVEGVVPRRPHTVPSHQR